jgi:RNA polymerase sigma factor for flagellar operon FliA
MQLSIKPELASSADDARSANATQDTRARRDRLVEQTLWVVRALAVEFVRNRRISLAREDLEAYGVCGLLEAADSFDERRGTKFSTFAYYRIRGAMLDALRRGAGSCTPSEFALLQELPVDALVPVAAPILRQHFLGTERHSAWRSIRSAGLTVIDHQLADLASGSLSEEHEDALNARIDEPLRATRLRAEIAALPELEREVIEHLYYEPGASLATAAAKFGRDRSWLCRVHARALKKLREALAAFGD